MLTITEGPLLEVFAAVVHAGSFSGAATKLKLSKSVVSERVRQLEARCGVRLLERTTRRLRLTENGTSVLEAATRVQDTLKQLSQGLDAGQKEPTGLLRIATTNDLGPALVGPVAARLVNAWPQVRVEILAEDGQRDLLGTGIDVAIRLGVPKSSTFVMRRLAVLEEPLVAAPVLAARFASAVRPRDLVHAPWVRHALVTGATMRFEGPHGARDELAPTVHAEANSGATVLSLLLHGAGVGVLPEHALREHLYAGRLVRLCPAWVWKRVTLFALMPSRTPRPVLQAFLAMVEEQLALDAVRWGAPARSRAPSK